MPKRQREVQEEGPHILNENDKAHHHDVGSHYHRLATAANCWRWRRSRSSLLLIALYSLSCLITCAVGFQSNRIRLLNSNNYRYKSSRTASPSSSLSSMNHHDAKESPSIGTEELSSIEISRRSAIRSLAVSTALLPAIPALAGKPSLDQQTGELYSPKADMLSGGSAAARGIKLMATKDETKLKPGQALQTVYETRFIAYLSRFLLTFDPSANAWWVKNALEGADTWELEQVNRDKLEFTFAEFAESVEIGLADYFVGPYGSYSSLSAMKAGLSASNPAKSARPTDLTDGSALNPLQALYSKFLKSKGGDTSTTMSRKRKDANFGAIAKQGVLNLFTLLKARYTTVAAKRQLAILFSFISDPQLQPTAEIRGLLGEIDNCTITKVELVLPEGSKETTRISSRIGGGYSIDDVPNTLIELPPSLESEYTPAKVQPIMKCTSRILRINVTDAGEGYISPPEVTITQRLLTKPCIASAMLDREGRVESIFTLDPGSGFGHISKGEPPKVRISSPTKGPRSKDLVGRTARRAQAVAELEYEISDIQLLDGGSGYVANEPPKIFISSPRNDPDWYLDSKEIHEKGAKAPMIIARVVEMKYPDGSIAYPMSTETMSASAGEISFSRLQNEPLELIPSTVRPEITSDGSYTVPAVSKVPAYASTRSPRYRAVDPLFGSIGSVPVTKGALELKTSEYARLALSGAVCTVLVRTALNPLELIKTKQQLATDKELLNYASDKLRSKRATEENVEDGSKKDNVGAFDLIQSLVELRGAGALFQSADITFLASLIFGSFGFGATELFRRSFTQAFFQEGGGGANSEIVLLLAATLATIITSFAASPFELLRVRSMGVLETTSWTQILADFVAENRSKSKKNKTEDGLDAMPSVLSLKTISFKDLPPLFAGFPPIASRELAFAIPKFLAFDVLAQNLVKLANAQADPMALPVQVGVGTEGLFISAISGALAGIAGAVVSHPADLILTYTSASNKKSDSESEKKNWKDVVKELLAKEGGITNLYLGLSPRVTFFFLVIGLQFFLYDFAKNLLQVSSDDLSLVLDVFAAVRQGLVDSI